MVSASRLRVDILDILHEHRILNTMEICRLLNSRDKLDFQWCCAGLSFGENRVGSEFNAGQCNHQTHGCTPKYRRVHNQLSLLAKKGWIHTKKMRFYDKSSRALATDIFRFWFKDEKEFENRILRQTLHPYIQHGGKT